MEPMRAFKYGKGQVKVHLAYMVNFQPVTNLDEIFDTMEEAICWVDDISDKIENVASTCFGHKVRLGNTHIRLYRATNGLRNDRVSAQLEIEG